MSRSRCATASYCAPTCGARLLRVGIPTLVYRTPYGKARHHDGAPVRQAVARGYAVVAQDVRGRYASDGVRAYERKAGMLDTIEWAAAQSWSNGRVGTFGLSYPGAVQWLAAIESPRT